MSGAIDRRIRSDAGVRGAWRGLGRPAGVSLVEVLIVLALLTILMTPLLMLFQQGTREIAMTAGQFRSHLAATEVLDQLLALPYDQLPVRSFTDSELREGSPIDAAGKLVFHLAIHKGFEREAIVTRVERDGYVRYKRITVSVRASGNPASAPDRMLQLTCLRANHGD